MICLTVHELSVNFGGLRAVDRVSCGIEAGTIHGLIGPNGAGKTTVFNCITGFYRPTSGTIRFRERDITGLRPDRIARLGIARTFQNVQLFRSLSALDNVLVAKHSHMRTGVFAEGLTLPFVRRQERRVRDKAEEIMAFMGLTDIQQQPAGNLPLGSQKRLELARALATEPALLLLDEVMAGLNATETERIVDLVGAINRRGIAVLLIEHVMRAVMSLSQRIVVLDHGELIAEGPAAAVADDPRVIEAYLGTAPA